MPNSHKSSKRGISARVEPDVHENLHKLALFNGTDFAGLMVKLANGEALKFPDGSDLWSKISLTKKGEK